MKALILNSGIGKRMGNLTASNHKSLIKLGNGETILGRQIRLLSECGISDFVITTGPFKEQIESIAQDYPNLKFTFVYNPAFASTNYIYSMYLARKYCNEDMLILHGDLVFSKSLVSMLLDDKRLNLAPVNKSILPSGKDFKARLADNFITEISVKISGRDCVAFQPFYKLSKDVVFAWMQKIEEFVVNENTTVYAENALNELLNTLQVEYFSYEGHFIDEIDTPEDLSRVSQEIRLYDFEEQQVFTGIEYRELIPRILAESGSRRPLLVHGKSFDKLYIKNIFRELPYDFVDFSGFSSNPRYEEIEAGVKLFLQEKCDFIISIGGGSAIDTAKCIKLFSLLNPNENYLLQEYKFSPVKHLAIPTTAGSGSEATHFAVLYYQGEKQSIAHDCLLPEYVILDAKLLHTLPDYQKKVALLDALCQGIESLWSVNSTPKSMQYAEKAIALILNNYQDYLRGDEAAAVEVLKGANYSGKAINISLTTAAHAMSYKLASLFGIAHGHAVALCLPHVWTYMIEHPEKCEDPRGLDHLNAVFNKLNSLFGVNNSYEAISKFSSIFLSLDLETYTDELGLLQKSVNLQRLQNTPVRIDYFSIGELYKSILAERKSYIYNASLKEHKQRTLEAYDWFQRYCAENNISFVVLGGTIIGALRHGGFVPWDDDIDIGIRLPELDKFRKLSKASLPPGFAWSHPDTYRRHPRLFGKIIYEGRCCLDLFPIVKTSRYRLISKIHHKMIRFLYKVYLRKIRYGKLPRGRKKHFARFVWYFTKFVSLFFSRESILSISEKVMRLFENKKKGVRYISICGRYPHDKELIEIEWMESEKEYLEFEGRLIPVFHNYQAYLKRIYGNYKILPPIDKRISDHQLRIPMHSVAGIVPQYMPRLQKLVCEILEEFIAICELYKLRYYAISGTALGAIRHKGFIPWDDDVDIAMPREDYDKFLKVAPKHLSGHLFLQTYETEPGCPRYYAKIRNSNTTFIEVGSKPDDRNRGIYIDIFPLDGFPSNKLKQLICWVMKTIFDDSISYVYNNFNLRKALFGPDAFKRIMHRMVGFLATRTMFRGYDVGKINRAKEDYFTKFKYEESELVCSYGGVYGKKEIIPKEFLGEGLKCKFGQLELIVPEKYHEYLTHFYGNYMQLPEENKRLVGHPRKIVDLEKSYKFYQ
ncbi:MAG TPA: iron-containing alcohol dehydrogenase [Bacillota bacterium]|nr:iron-containing alcohol dehydrogenase [Bacillota bacterium]